ncbi:exocyst complex component EXO70A1-like protein [Tanacetum coccineum]
MQLNLSCYCLTEEVLGAISGDNKRKEVGDSVSFLYRIFDRGDILKFSKVAFHSTGYDTDAQIQSVVEKRDAMSVEAHDIAVKVEDGDDGGGVAAKGTELGKEMEYEALKRISETLTANDFLDICIDIFVKGNIESIYVLGFDNWKSFLLTLQLKLNRSIWKNGILSVPETDENLLREAILNAMEALQRNIKSKKLGYNVLYHVFVGI